MWKKLLAIVAMLYAVAAFAAVDVNKASAAELDGIKGIGPSISTKIVDERKKGNFKDWNDFIERVKGVGEGNAAKFSTEGMTVNGAGFKVAVAAKAAATVAPAAAAAAPTTAAPAAKTDKADAKAQAKMKADEAKKAKAEEKAKKAEDAKAKKDMAKQPAADKKNAKADAPSTAASAAKK